MNRNRKKKEILICALMVASVLLIIGKDVNADFIFGTPTNLGPTVNSTAWDNDPIVSADGLSLFFDSKRPGGYGGFDVWVTTRETVQDSWGQPVNLGPPINTDVDEASGGISPDGLEFYFVSNRPGGLGSYDIWVTTRETIQDMWGDPVNLGSPINSSSDDFGGVISADGLEFYFNSSRAGGSGGVDLWVTTRETIKDQWGNPVNLGSQVNSPGWDYSAAPSPDGLLLFFSSSRPSEYGDWTIWVTKRETRDGDWGAPVNLGPAVNSWEDQENPYISADGSTLYFASTRPGGSGYVDLWQVSIEPIVDLNGDGIVDSADMCKIVNYWGEDDPLFDIGPMPWGDGVLDVEDLIILSEHLFEDVNDPTLTAHWSLDETEGMTAHDNVSGSNDFIMGNALWKPNEGKVKGAIELDGIDDCIIGGASPNPTEGSFSIVAWIKGGAPGQVIFALPGRSDLLALDTNGNLVTELNGLGQSTAALHSEAVVTDGQWHRVGLVWDGSRRKLFVDGVKVTEDTEDGHGIFGTGLYIGVDKNYTPGTFFSGLIDEVRIYNRAVHP